MGIEHTKQYGIYHWDTFDNTTLLIGEADTIGDAQVFIEQKYKGKISQNGADQVDIVDLRGNIIGYYKVS